MYRVLIVVIWIVLILYVFLFFFQCYDDHRYLHVLTPSFPTRRSSDLERRGDDAAIPVLADRPGALPARALSPVVHPGAFRGRHGGRLFPRSGLRPAEIGRAHI